MKVIVFEQWDKLVALLRGLAANAAAGSARRAVRRVEPQGRRVVLDDRAANVLDVGGGETTVVMPNAEPGAARGLSLRVTASGANTLVFEGADAFEGEAGALDPPADGETVVYFFAETAAGVMSVERKAATRIEQEGEG